MTDPPGATSRWATAALPLVLVGLALLSVAGYLVLGHRGGAGTQPHATTAAGSAVPSSELTGEWTGEGTVTQCAGVDDADCRGTRTVTLTINCTGKRCTVTPFDRRYGHPPLRFTDGSYRAAGPLPPALAPTCGGAPTSTAQWRLELSAHDGRLTGTYAERTVQSFDCGATGLMWAVSLERR